MFQTVKDSVKQAAIFGGLEASSFLRALKLATGKSGRGVIFTLHHVRPFAPQSFTPNRHLEITPEFLDAAIRRLKAEGYVFPPLTDIENRLADRNGPRFAIFTLDDGNRDNFDHALPVFERNGVPFTVFVTRGLSDATSSMWWETLEALLLQSTSLRFDFGRGEEAIDATTPAAKLGAYNRIAHFIMQEEAEAAAVSKLDALARHNGLDPLDITRSLIMDAEALKALANRPLASLGAHTMTHRALGRLEDGDAQREIAGSIDYVADIIGRNPTAIAYPYGTTIAANPRVARIAADCGLVLGLSTRPGVITPSSDKMLLPRISLNGLYQKPRYAAALASGLPLRLMGRSG